MGLDDNETPRHSRRFLLKLLCVEEYMKKFCRYIIAVIFLTWYLGQ